MVEIRRQTSMYQVKFHTVQDHVITCLTVSLNTLIICFHRLWAWRSRVRFFGRHKIFFSPQWVQMGPFILLLNKYWSSFPRVTRPGNGVDHTPYLGTGLSICKAILLHPLRAFTGTLRGETYLCVTCVRYTAWLTTNTRPSREKFTLAQAVKKLHDFTELQDKKKNIKISLTPILN